MKKIILSLSMIFGLNACQNPQKTIIVQPNIQQQTQQSNIDQQDLNQQYQVYQNGGQQYAIVMINGQQQYVPYNIFQQQMAIGGYGALNDYYYSNSNYFHPFIAGMAGWMIMNSLCGNYYNHYHINSYRTYHTVHIYHHTTINHNYSNNYNSNSRNRVYNTRNNYSRMNKVSTYHSSSRGYISHHH